MSGTDWALSKVISAIRNKSTNEVAPFALFVYNRPWHTRQTVEALQKNEFSAESDLFIFFRRPALRQLRVHVGLEVRVGQKLPRQLGRASRGVLSLRGPVGAPCPLRPAEFPSVRAGCSSDLLRTHSQTAPCHQFAADFLAFGEAQACGLFHTAQLRSPGVDQNAGVALGTRTQGEY